MSTPYFDSRSLSCNFWAPQRFLFLYDWSPPKLSPGIRFSIRIMLSICRILTQTRPAISKSLSYYLQQRSFSERALQSIFRILSSNWRRGHWALIQVGLSHSIFIADARECFAPLLISRLFRFQPDATCFQHFPYAPWLQPCFLQVTAKAFWYSPQRVFCANSARSSCYSRRIQQLPWQPWNRSQCRFPSCWCLVDQPPQRCSWNW